MRLRTHAQIMRALLVDDPDTSLSAWALRRMVLTGEIPSVQVGRKRLIDLDILPECLARSAAQSAEPVVGAIRRVV